MSDLPAGWTLSTLEELAVNPTADIVDGPFGSNLKASEYQEKGIPIIRLQNVKRSRFIDKNIKYVSSEKAKELQRHSFVAGDLVITKLGDPLGEAAIVPEKFENGIIVADIVRARLDTKLADKKYVMYAINSPEVITSLENEVKGTTRPRVNLGHIRRLEIPLAPLNEQKRIAEKLDTLLARVDSCQTHLERVPQILKRFRESVLAAATLGRLTEEWRAEQKDLPEYRSVTLREVATAFNYGTSAKSQKSGKIPVLRMGNIQDGKLDWNDLVFTSDSAEIKKYNLVNGDVLFNRTNSPELVGKTAVYKGEQPAIFAGYLIKVKCSDDLLPDFLNYCLNSPAGRDWAWQVKSDGVSQSNINAQKLADFEFELPPIEEQAEIVRRVEKLFTYADRLEARYLSASEHVERLTPALLAKAFRGELVEQDPNDEPASVLLERIRDAIANAPKEVKKTRRRPEMKAKKNLQAGMRVSVVQALQDAGKELSSEELFTAAGYPADAESELVEEFLVDVRDSLRDKQIKRRRRNDADLFSLSK